MHDWHKDRAAAVNVKPGMRGESPTDRRRETSALPSTRVSVHGYSRWKSTSPLSHKHPPRIKYMTADRRVPAEAGSLADTVSINATDNPVTTAMGGG